MCYGDILQKTHHVIFLDTPHLGLNVKAFGAVFGAEATLRGCEQVGLWSSALTDLGKSFAEIGSKISITSVYASLPVILSGKPYSVRRIGFSVSNCH